MKPLKTPKFRVSFPNVFTKSAYKKGEPKYNITMLFDSDADLSEMRKKIDEVKNEKWPKGAPKDFYHPIRDAGGTNWNGFKDGMFYVRAKSTIKPGIVDRNLQPLMSEDEFYPGCYAIATYSVYAYDDGSVGVGIGLRNLMKVADGERLDGRTAAEDDFEPYQEEDDVFK